MYSLPVEGNYTVMAEYAFDSRDIQILPTTEWRYALQVCFVCLALWLNGILIALLSTRLLPNPCQTLRINL
jgi:hypothetical protein